MKAEKKTDRQIEVDIYIPIWIDLKADRRGRYKELLPYLHSNMDRFESRSTSLTAAILFHLHSNMDRFESRIKKTYCKPEMLIYIPIWIDLKA